MKKKYDFAFPPRPQFLSLLRACEQMAPKSPRWKTVSVPLLVSELGLFFESLKEAICSLPESPGRRRIPVEELRILQAQFIPVSNSERVLAKALRAFRLATGSTLTVTAFGNDFWKNATEERKRFRRLWSYLYRQSDHYKKWSEKYYAREDVQARLADRPREPKAAAAERMRRTYWKQKGVDVPPPKSPGHQRNDELRSLLHEVGFGDEFAS